MKTVAFVELTAFDKIVPLASGYLYTYAMKDPEIQRDYAFSIVDAPVTVDRAEFAARLSEQPADVYALSCYVWNMGLVSWLLTYLVEHLPDARFVLGGPQVMSHAKQYVRPEWANVAVCNGEGERTFHEYLRQLRAEEPDLAAVPGLSFWQDGELVTTDRPERIKDLTEVPSPYTAGLFEPGRYTFAILETNRGCPYRCGFCFWGAATNAKVNRFETDRVLEDISWMSENGMATVFLADANWGMAPRDVDFTKHIVECRSRTGYPMVVSMNAAKNRPDRVAEITRILVDGGLLTSQPISLQSMDDDVLNLIDRSNIRAETYTELQRTLREQAISSYIEMIWPLPGETVASFRQGLTELCRSRADTILVYPQLLLHNTPIYVNRDRFGVGVRRVPDEVAEADVVVATKWVDEADYEEGVRVYYAMTALYNQRGLYYLANYLDRTGLMTFGDLFAVAAEYFGATDSSLSRFVADSVATMGNYYLLNAGRLAHLILHSERGEADRLFADFVASQPFGTDPTVQAMLELDLLARPYIYRESPTIPDHDFRHLDVRPAESAGFVVTAPEAVTTLLAELDLPGATDGGPLMLTHPGRHKLPYLRHRTLEENISYCQGMTLHLREMLPAWQPVQPVASTA